MSRSLLGVCAVLCRLLVAVPASSKGWLVYHGIPSDNPDLLPASNGTLKLTRRPMLTDRLDWIDGWPALRAGAGPSGTAQPAPTTTTFTNEKAQPGWTFRKETDAGTYATTTDVRAEADLRVSGKGAAGLTVAYRNENNNVAIRLDQDHRALITEVVRGGHPHDRQTTALPTGFTFETWHHVAVEVRGTHLATSIYDLTVKERNLPSAAVGHGAVGVAAAARTRRRTT